MICEIASLSVRILIYFTLFVNMCGEINVKECPICKSINNDKANICFNCGTIFKTEKIKPSVNKVSSEPKMKICPQCKAINNGNASSCYHCDARFVEKTQSNGCDSKNCLNGQMNYQKDTDHMASKIILKVVLYLSAGVVYGFIKTMLEQNGILIGALPTIVILGALFLIASRISKSL